MNGAGLRRSLLAAALTLAALSGCAHRPAKPDSSESTDRPPREAVELIRDMSFADQDLDVLLAQITLVGDANRAVELLNAGKVQEAAKVMTPEARHAAGPGAALADARIKQRLGDAKGAEEALRGVLRETGIEARWRLWAAHALKQMGAKLDEDVADVLLGVVVETPGDAGLETLAIYPDLNMRYIPEDGPILGYDPEDGRLNEAIAAIGPPAQAVYLKAPLVAEGPRPALVKDEFRFTFLTPRGPRRVRESLDTVNTGQYQEVFRGFANLMQTLVKLHQDAQGEQR